MKYIENWQNKDLRCHFCGQTKSVKYTVELTEYEGTKEVPCCNRCVLRFGGGSDERN